MHALQAPLALPYQVGHQPAPALRRVLFCGGRREAHRFRRSAAVLAVVAAHALGQITVPRGFLVICERGVRHCTALLTLGTGAAEGTATTTKYQRSKLKATLFLLNNPVSDQPQSRS